MPAASDAAATPFDLVLQHAVLADGAAVDIAIRDGAIVAVAPSVPGAATQRLALDGRVVLPGFVEAHTHLDKAFTVELALNRSGTLYEAVELMGTLQTEFTVASVHERALRAARLFVAAGVTTLRTHVDIGPSLNLVAVEALLAVRQQMQGMLDLQLVTLCSRLAEPGDGRQRWLIEEALCMGVDAVGGAPMLDTDHRAHIDWVFGLAERYDRPIDFHVDESDDPGDFCLPYLAEKTGAAGYAGRVMAGHCCSLSAVDDARARDAIERVREAGISVVTLPSANMYLQGRGDLGLVRRGLTRVRALIDAGVTLCCGSDNVQDPFNPFGRPDPLHVANLLAHAAHLGSPREQEMALRAITAAPAAALGVPGYGIGVGCVADLVVLDTTEPRTLLATLPPRRYVIKRGRVVAQTRTVVELTPPL